MNENGIEKNSLIDKTVDRETAMEVSKWSPAYLKQEQLADADIAPALTWLNGDGRPDFSEVESSSPALRALYQQYESLILRDGVVYRIFHNVDTTVKYYQLVLPRSLKVPFLEMLHSDTAGHLKYVKCVPHVANRAWWFSWKRDLKLFIQCCKKCSKFHKGGTPKQAVLHPMNLGSPCERWCVDLCGPYPMSNGQNYIFSAICPFSKFIVLKAIRSKNSDVVAKVILDEIILKWGMPYEVLSDCGGEFSSELYSALLKLLGIAKLRTTSFHPQGNGCCETMHRTMHKLLSKVVSESQRDWPQLLNYVAFCYNSTMHSSVGFSPYFIMTGRDAKWHIDFLLNNVDQSEQTVPEFTATVVERLNKVHDLVRENLKRTAEYSSRWYNRKVREKTFVEGSRVYVYFPRHVKGRTPKWQ